DHGAAVDPHRAVDRRRLAIHRSDVLEVDRQRDVRVHQHQGPHHRAPVQHRARRWVHRRRRARHPHRRALLLAQHRAPRGAQPGGQGRLPPARQQVLPRRPVHGRDRGRHLGPDRPGRVLDQSERHRRRRQRRRRRHSRRGPLHLQRDRPEGRRRPRQRRRIHRRRRRQHPAHHPDRAGTAVRRRHVRGGGHLRRRPDQVHLGSTMNAFDHWALSLAVFIPLVGAAVAILIPRSNELAVKVVALVTTLATAGVGVYLAVNFDYDKSHLLQFQVDRSWIDVINSRFHVGIDGISLPLLLLSMLITVLCVIYSWDHFPEPHNPKAFLILMLVLETGMNGTFAAQDLILFFVFFELVLLPMYFMIGVWGGPNRQYASIKFFLFTLFGSALMILSFLALY